MKPIKLCLWCEDCSVGLQIGERGALGAWLYHESFDEERFAEFYGRHEGHRITFGTAPEPSEWQPIDTAPKDKTWVLVYSEDGYMDVAYSDGLSWNNEGYGPTGGQVWPTHWMPLPLPPEAPK